MSEESTTSRQENRALRNSVLTEREDAVKSNVGMKREDFAKKQFGLEIPVDAVPLPSKGKLYSPDHPLHNAERVEYRAMTAKEEDILMSRALIKRGTVITELIKSCLMDPDIDVNSLVSGDRNALMIAIRISGYGREYKPSMVCPTCEAKNELDIDLADLNINSLNIEPAEAFTNFFHFKLPVSKKTLGFKFLTGEEEETILRTMEAKRKKGILNDNLVTTRLMSSVVEIEGNRDRTQISQFVQYMPARDSLALREYIDEHEPGVDMTVDFGCQACDYMEKINLPLGPNFFWPNARR